MKDEGGANVDDLLGVAEGDGKDEADVGAYLWQLRVKVELRVPARPHLPEEDANLVDRDGDGYSLPTSHLDQELVDNERTSVLEKR